MIKHVGKKMSLEANTAKDIDFNVKK